MRSSTVSTIALVFAATALASPAGTLSTDGFVVTDDTGYVYTIPAALESVFETAIPASWESSLIYNTAFASSVLDAEASGILPDWYNSLPETAKEFYSTLVAGEDTYLATADIATATATATATTSGPLISHSSNTVTSTPLLTTKTRTKSTSSDFTATTSTGSATDSSSLSFTFSATSTSTGGAPAATGGVAVGMAGAFGILGLALAL